MAGGDDFAFLGLARQAEMVRAGEVSPTELVGQSLERIDRIDPQLNSFRKVFADKAMLEAEQAEARRSAGDKRPLLGVPIAIKDEIDVAGEINLHGTDAFEVPAKADAGVVRRLREAGAIIVGLTLLPELAICGFTESATYGVTRNPWNPQRTPGGSSGGSASAVAAGLVPIASAGDGAGSIRIPAACCGLFGLKPTRGRVSLAPKLEGWRGLAVEGCVSRSVLDSALWLDVVSGGSTEDEAPSPPAKPFVESVKDSPGKLRVGWSTAPPRALAPPTVSDEVKQTVVDAAAFLGTLGHDVSPRDPDWGRVGDTITARFLKGVAETVEEVPLPERLERRTRGFGRLGGLLPEALYEKAIANRPAEIARINAIFDDVDVLVMPVMGGTALPIRRWQGRGALHTVLGMSRFYPYCVPWNHLGNPAMSIPFGLGADGMPLAIQIIGRPESEPLLISLAAQIEAERPWADLRPPIS
ncbi:MAG TPA: amidase [Solirubrobacterales bacterium]|jgi:amidase|nr:amidase [Solirubrobacterales bacterium]